MSGTMRISGHEGTPHGDGTNAKGRLRAAGRRELMETGLIVLFLALVVLFLTSTAVSQRRTVHPPQVHVLSRPQDAYDVWIEKNVHGRTLLLFDRFLNADARGLPVGPDNYVYLAIEHGLVRKIHHIIPDGMWDEASSALAKNVWAVPTGRGYRMAAAEGVPVRIVPLSRFEPGDETYLVNLNGDLWSGKEVRAIAGLLAGKRTRFDVLTISGPVPDAVIADLGRAHEE